MQLICHLVSRQAVHVQCVHCQHACLLCCCCSADCAPPKSTLHHAVMNIASHLTYPHRLVLTVALVVVQFFYSEQLHRMECLSQEPVLFEDVLCQMHDMIQPAKEGCFTLTDLKRHKPLAGTLFNMLFNLHKFIAFETRDPFLARQVRTVVMLHCTVPLSAHNSICFVSVPCCCESAFCALGPQAEATMFTAICLQPVHSVSQPKSGGYVDLPEFTSSLLRQHKW